jgi:O-ureido-D-serine cyclo-ligase
VARVTHLVNHPTVLGWNIDKRYLADLADAGVPTVPTTWVEPPASIESAESSEPIETLGQRIGPLLSAAFHESDVVIKPAVSGGAYQTARYRPDGADAARDHIRRLLHAGRTVMVQPYQAAVDAQGEVGVVYLGSQFSHAVAKGAMLKPGAGTQENLWEHEDISAVVPTELQLATARSALAAAEHLVGATTYARVDLVTRADGVPAVLELELLDSALFFETQPAAATRFAAVLRQLIP